MIVNGIDLKFKDIFDIKKDIITKNHFTLIMEISPLLNQEIKITGLQNITNIKVLNSLQKQ